ncbi:hypothetical protein PILCRDRAFT_522573 [Piloderma croceum F 1598]|uniref:Uncharacterized protein n=1 Tax=Piloderma croceum (strain F 1598) TaxID=765440 RepID=A0A0C3F870_PILCF|nr:hypothetical protein PILCRDRAFT_522573 [Piloderma croceum F 1598]
MSLTMSLSVGPSINSQSSTYRTFLVTAPPSATSQSTSCKSIFQQVREPSTVSLVQHPTVLGRPTLSHSLCPRAWHVQGLAR